MGQRMQPRTRFVGSVVVFKPLSKMRNWSGRRL
jgi:hypothetical protein